MRLCFKNNLRPHTKKDFNEIKKQKILSILEAVFLFEEKQKQQPFFTLKTHV